MEFLFELLKEIAFSVRELSAYALRKQFKKKDNKNPALHRPKYKRGSKRKR
ncbi:MULTISPECIES: hypothetical protein [Bacillus]|uniref:Conserved domain protein n=1 Tax=Bacillus anthracis TaxID=1392 RepID=Q6EZJ9_BACAN|nr:MULTISPECIES: hypothetical protein [Bacillus]AAM26131.1 hypothetical protein BX_A0186 [Bacillus anthracis str. A2012]EJT17146.1 hypothetical protein B353_31128 [Bacillus anthracis str. UR-1]EXJ17433.1 hypothetical protein Y693_28795 [Bacillus anthracis str. 95014]AAT35478.1 conserved domain protein [Bacillus anthracis str. 'Ames Ancestor']AFH87037.1 Hypothetical Protein H9401_5652 [Bacillus anthracis str. H9401]